jgi:hypothetical protein
LSYVLSQRFHFAPQETGDQSITILGQVDLSQKKWAEPQKHEFRAWFWIRFTLEHVHLWSFQALILSFSLLRIHLKKTYINIMVKFVWLSYILKSIFSTVRMVQNQFDQIGCSGNPVQVRDLHVLQCVYI